MTEQQKAPVKTLYHGEFRQLGDVEVVVKSGILESKKKKGEYYVILTLGGVDRYLHPENLDCRDFWFPLRGKTVTVRAEGQREEARFVLLSGGDEQAVDQPSGPSVDSGAPEQPREGQHSGPPAKTRHRPSQAAQPPPQRQNDVRQPPPTPDDPLAAAKAHVARNLTMTKIALKAFMKLNEEFASEAGAEIPDALAGPILGALLFGASSAGVVQHLPLDIDLHTLSRRVK